MKITIYVNWYLQNFYISGIYLQTVELYSLFHSIRRCNYNLNHLSVAIRSKYTHFSDDTHRKRLSTVVKFDGSKFCNWHAATVKVLLNMTVPWCRILMRDSLELCCDTDLKRPIVYSGMFGNDVQNIQ